MVAVMETTADLTVLDPALRSVDRAVSRLKFIFLLSLPILTMFHNYEDPTYSNN